MFWKHSNFSVDDTSFRGLCQHRIRLKICIFRLSSKKLWNYFWCLQDNLRRYWVQVSFVIHVKTFTLSSINGDVALDKVFSVYLTLVCRRCWFYVFFMTRKKFCFRSKSFQVQRFELWHFHECFVETVNGSWKIFTLACFAQFVIRKTLSLFWSYGVCRTCFYYFQT